VALEPSTLTFDCADPVAVATFWAAAMGYELDDDSDETGAYVADPSGRTHGMFFQPVPEAKIAKNRVHLDVRPTTSMAVEVERLKGLGATERGFIEVEGSFWTQMRDPEGNEFCVLRGPDDGWESGQVLS
jgi:predicted enzyme related to lactoylglutathione lyase